MCQETEVVIADVRGTVPAPSPPRPPPPPESSYPQPSYPNPYGVADINSRGEGPRGPVGNGGNYPAEKTGYLRLKPQEGAQKDGQPITALKPEAAVNVSHESNTGRIPEDVKVLAPVPAEPSQLPQVPVVQNGP